MIYVPGVQDICTAVSLSAVEDYMGLVSFLTFDVPRKLVGEGIRGIHKRIVYLLSMDSPGWLIISFMIAAP